MYEKLQMFLYKEKELRNLILQTFLKQKLQMNYSVFLPSVS